MEYSFKRFLNLKNEDKKKKLILIKKMLEKNHMKVFDHLDDEDPYVYIESTESNQSFGGVRLYSLGEDLAFRIQKKQTTHPYGSAYSINFQEIFSELMKGEITEEEAGTELMKVVAEGFKKFFDESKKAERKSFNQKVSTYGGGVIAGQNTQYSNTMMTSN